MLRTALERVSRKLVLHRRLPGKFGGYHLYVTPDAALRHFGRLVDVDSRLMELANDLVHPRDVVWDIGANIGLFSFTAARKADRVIAVEPDPTLIALLQRSVQRNGFKHVTLLCAVIASGPQIQTLHVANRGRASNFIGEFGHETSGGVRYDYDIPGLTLDAMLDRYPPPNVIKIDVEGAEHLVLQGASVMLRKYRPRLICEVSPAQLEFVSKLFRQTDYVLFDANTWGNPGSQALEQPAWNTVALPAENVSRLAAAR